MMKCFERILDSRIRVFVEPYLGEEQFGFRKGKGIDAMFIVRQMMERKLEFQQESCWGFLDLEKAYDKINRGMIPLRLYSVPEELINMVMALYRTPSTQVRTLNMVMALYRTPSTQVSTCFGKTKAFEVKVGLHQGSALSPLLFIILMDYISKQCPMESRQKVIYAHDIALGANMTGITTSSRHVGQPTGSTWYEDEQEENGSTRSLERATSAKPGDYCGWTATETNNSL